MPYRPVPWLRSGHLQTLMVGLQCGWRPPYSADRLLIDLPDGEQLVVHAERPSPLDKSAPIVILIHGLGGDHSSPYLQRLAHRLAHRGMRVWRVDLRGCGAGFDLAWRPPHAGRSDDVAAVVQLARRRFPDSVIRLVGFSLSGNIVLKMLGEAAIGNSLVGPEDVERAIAIAPPVELSRCADRIDRLDNNLYTRYYLKMLGKQVNRRRGAWEQWAKLPTKPVPRTIRQFDALYTAPLSGFKDTEHYYASSSARPLMEFIKTPTTILVDQHDPIIEPRSFRDLPENESLAIQWTRHGGHMGYFGRDDAGKPVRWMELFVTHRLLRES